MTASSPGPAAATTAAAASIGPPRLDWASDGRDWPNRAFSQHLQCDGLHWHVQRLGVPGRPGVLLLHGTGASTHSWRDVAPRLAEHFDVLVPDLPGHAFTGMPAGGTSSLQLSLPGMARAVAALVAALGHRPALVVGHSAGAAIAVRMALDALVLPRAIVSFNGALLPLAGLAGRVFSPAARLLAAVPAVPRLFARRAADPVALQRLLDGTGSTLDATGTALYRRLVSNPGHAAGALGMMAGWNLHALQADLPRLAVPLGLVTGSRDLTVPPAQATQVWQMLGEAARLARQELPGLGHLAHEERPDLAADIITSVWQQALAAGAGAVRTAGAGGARAAAPARSEPRQVVEQRAV